MFGHPRKLKPQEITQALDKIRQEYDHYIVRYEKTPTLKKQFEHRIYLADLKRMDMTFFISQEMRVLQELILQAETEKADQAKKSGQPKKNTVQGKSYADRILEKLQKQIEEYPTLAVHPQASIDVEKLYGTVNWIYINLWPSLVPILRDLGVSQRIILEDEFTALTPHQGRLPKDLDHLAHLIDSGTPLNQQSQQQKICLVKAAALIGLLRKTLSAALGKTTEKSQKLYLEKTRQYLEKAATDFRLKNITPV